MAQPGHIQNLRDRMDTNVDSVFVRDINCDWDFQSQVTNPTWFQVQKHMNFAVDEVLQWLLDLKKYPEPEKNLKLNPKFKNKVKQAENRK